MTFPSIDQVIDPAINILPGTDLAPLWDRFEVFEALHHTMQICNPMTSAQLDEAVAAMKLRDGMRVLDMACGYGETLFRAVAQVDITAVGIDLSPWMITAAHRQAVANHPGADVQWVLGDARDFRLPNAPDVIVCIGAEWVWHDMRGTLRELSKRVDDGGLVVVGGARRHFAATDDDLVGRGTVETIDDIERLANEYALAIEHRIDPDDAGWDAYLERTAVAAQQWAVDHPGERAERWIAEQDDWQAARERDRKVIGWSLWIARKEPAGQRIQSR